jgi:hypothetical protein
MVQAERSTRLLNPRSPVVVGFFTEMAQVERALEVLRGAGFSDGQVFVLLQEEEVSRYQLFEKLLKMEMLEEEANYCVQEYASGYHIVAVRHEGRRWEAINILYNHRIHLYRKRLGGTEQSYSASPVALHAEESVTPVQIASPTAQPAASEETTGDTVPDWKRLLIDSGLDKLLDQLP